MSYRGVIRSARNMLGDDFAELVAEEMSSDPHIDEGWSARGPAAIPDHMNEATPTPPEPIMQFFAYDHLPRDMQAISKMFASVAESVLVTLPRNAERTVALRKLLEAKDAAVRASIAK